ncbi:MAG: PAS domain-containing protein [Candidatus Eremiobacteraeota bacterium]|nr:PAS domain-containing protein [Candidatus Eremiobacteraeota bacterium]
MSEREIPADVLLRAINASGDVVLVYRVDPDGKMRLTYMNDAYARQTGYTREEALGRELDAFRLAMPDDEGMRAIRTAFATGQAGAGELISYRKDGSTFWNEITVQPIVENGRVTHWVTIERDISSEVERTSALAEEHDRLLALVRAARRLFTVFDARELVARVKEVVRDLIGAEVHVLTANPAGASVEVEDLGTEVTFSAVGDDRIARAIGGKGRIVDEVGRRAIVYAGQYGDGRYVLDASVGRARRLRNTDLFVLDLIAEYFAVAARNVALYHELDERRSAVMELNQTKSDLIAMLAHDFRGPLTSVVGFAELIAEVGELNEEQLEFLESIKRSALQLSELASDTLTLSRLERNEVGLQFADVDVAELVRGIAEQYADRREVDVTVAADAHVTGDEERLRQVFSNLIDNAIKYSPGKSSPSVEIVGAPDAVVVSVRDKGIGIPTAELSTIFDRFSRATNARKLGISGTGFGLFLTKQLVQLHGGTIAVESREGEGSKFVVTLPRRVVRAAAPRTIVIFDENRDGSFLAHGLREGGYRVRTAAAVDEVLAIADSESLDAVIVNVEEATLASDQAARLRAFSRERSIPIIAIGGESSPRLGAIAAVPKPVLAGDLLAILERIRPLALHLAR